MAPWKGPRHRSWASDTRLTLIFAGVILATYLIWEAVGEAPQGLVTLVAIAGGALFGAVSGDRNKRAAETEQRVERVEKRADDAELRESGWSQHRDHDETDGGK